MEYLFITDPDVLEAASIDQLKDMKQYMKLTQKLEKEIDTMRKKQEKVSIFHYTIPTFPDGPPLARADFVMTHFRDTRK